VVHPQLTVVSLRILHNPFWYFCFGHSPKPKHFFIWMTQHRKVVLSSSIP
jgi:hypothetical protein